jgi:hypothetical protein|tara:strand:+ start:18 stop:182 length:165 start_codon:yes stop_codon:yes gene_type:complete
MKIEIITGEEARRAIKKASELIDKRIELAKGLGATSTEGIVFEDGKVRSIDLDD